MIKIMKAMKHLLIVISLMSILSLNAQTMVEYPVAQMQSTSSMVGSGSTLPNAASSGFISADDNLPTSSPRGPRRVIDEDDKEEEKPAEPVLTEEQIEAKVKEAVKKEINMIVACPKVLIKSFKNNWLANLFWSEKIDFKNLTYFFSHLSFT